MSFMNPTIKVAVTGAAGQIGYSILFRIASGQMFGEKTPVILHLIEVPQAIKALEGVVMELQDCAFPLVQNIKYTSDLKEGMDGINWAVLVGAAPRKPGMERSDLLAMNGGIFSTQGKAMNDYAARDVRALVVGNPCNTNALIAMHHAKDIPHDRFFAMTRLDQNRALHQLAHKAGVHVTQVRKMGIWGNHSATQYPDFYHAEINDCPATEVTTDMVWLQGEFISMVQQRGAAILAARGLSSAASAANAAIQTVHDLIFDTEDWVSVGKYSHGEYGTPEGIICSFPGQTKNGQFKVVAGLTLNEFSQQKIVMSTKELEEEFKMVKKLGLI